MSSTGKEEVEENVKLQLQVLHVFYKIIFDMFFDIISFQHVLHFDVGRSEIEWNMKVKMEISVFCIGPKVTQNTIAIPI